MLYQYNPYIWPLLVSAAVTLTLGLYALLLKFNVRGAKSFAFSMLLITIWSLGNALEMTSIDLPTKLFWANIQYFAYCYSPVMLVALCLQMTGIDYLLNDRRIMLLAIIPTIIIMLVWTDNLHGLIRYDIKLDYSGVFPVISKNYGPLFYLHALYSYALNILAMVLQVKAVLSKNVVRKKQAAALLLGICFIVIPNILYITNISPVKRFDTTPLFFVPAGLIMAWGIFRYKMFDVIPVARVKVIDMMDAGIMVLDLQDRVLDINPALEKILGRSAAEFSTKNVQEACSQTPELISLCMDRKNGHKEFTLARKDNNKIYEAVLSPLTSNGELIGRLVIIYDITKVKQEEKQFLQQQRRLAMAEERERLSRDLHDNLGQVLGFLSLQAQGIQKELLNADVDLVSDKLDRLVEATSTAHDELRAYIRRSRSTAIAEISLITELTNCIADFEKESGLRIELELAPELSNIVMKVNVRLQLLYIIKEALNNIRKHAAADLVKVSLRLVEEQLSIEVEDNGQGFCLNTADNDNNKFGIQIMRERAAEIGAELEITSIIGQGSRVTLCVPLGREELANESHAGR